MRVSFRLPGRVVGIWAVIKSNWWLTASLAVALLALGLSELGHKNHLWRSIAHVLLALYCISVLCAVVWKMIDKTRYGNFSFNLLLVIATLTALLLRQYWTAIVIISVHFISEIIGSYGERQTQRQLRLMLSAIPVQAVIIRGRKTNQVSSGQVQRGDKILIEPGRIVPVDCEIVEGNTEVDEKLFTAQSDPVSKSQGDWLLAGSLNLTGQVAAKALQTEENSQYENLVKILRLAGHSKTKFVHQAQRFVIPFTALSLLIAGGTWLWSHDSKRFLEVLVVATPSGLLLGSALGIRSGLAKAASNGVFIKSARAFENLATLRTLAFDKVGIVTSGRAEVSQVVSFSKNFTKSQLLALAGSFYQNRKHPLAPATLAAAARQNLRLVKARGLQENDGGLSAYFGRQEVSLGSKAYLQGRSYKLAKEAVKLEGLVNFIAADGNIIGAIVYSEDSQPEARKFVDTLHNAGVKDSLLITTDSHKLANEMAASHGISSVVAEATAISKISSLENTPPASRPLGYVGDGLTDALALSTADVGIAIGCAASVHAGDPAKVLIIRNDILAAAGSIEEARSSLGRAQLAILSGIGFSLGLMGLFAAGRIPALYGPIFILLVDLTVTGIVLGKQAIAGLRQQSQQAYDSQGQAEVI